MSIKNDCLFFPLNFKYASYNLAVLFRISFFPFFRQPVGNQDKRLWGTDFGNFGVKTDLD